MLSVLLLSLGATAPAIAAGPPVINPAENQVAIANTPSPTTPGVNSSAMSPGVGNLGGVNGAPSNGALMSPNPPGVVGTPSGNNVVLPGANFGNGAVSPGNVGGAYGGTRPGARGAGTTSGSATGTATATATSTGTSMSPGTVDSTGAPTGSGY